MHEEFSKNAGETLLLRHEDGGKVSSSALVKLTLSQLKLQQLHYLYSHVTQETFSVFIPLLMQPS